MFGEVMAQHPIITIDKLSKIYKLYHTPLDRLKETFHPFHKQYHQEFYALKDISFTVGKGEILGIVGKNGSGKSTLLQLITGVLTPTTGSIEAQGRISALLELGAGFNPELSGLENVFFKSSLLGNSATETQNKLAEILEFADIGEFIHQPVKTYSSGMFVRLAFAVAINVDPDILIVDEALSVGDFRFRQKCLRKIKKFREEGKTILFVSHDTGAVIEFCTRVIWLSDGRIQMDGGPADVCKDYISFMSFGEVSVARPDATITSGSRLPGETDDDSRRLPWVRLDQCSSFGQRGALIQRMAFYRGSDFSRIDVFEGGERVVLAVEIVAENDIENPIIGFLLGDMKGIHVLGMNSHTLGITVPKFSKGETRVVEFEFDFPFLKTGSYSFSPAIAEGDHVDNIVQHHWVHDAWLLKIASDYVGARLGHYLVIKEGIDVRIK